MTADTFLTSHKPSLTLEARSLTCVRGEKQLFDGLNLKISAGECLHVRGENGVGKTSLLRLLTGLSKPESGEIFWGGLSISKETTQYRRELLFLGHRDALKDDLTALENLQLYAALDEVDLSEDKALAALWRFGLRAREHLPISCLSAGQKRRVLMARMLTRQAQLWILDEPFNALDVHGVQDLQGLIAEHVQCGGIVVLSSHQEMGLPDVRILDL